MHFAVWGMYILSYMASYSMFYKDKLTSREMTPK